MITGLCACREIVNEERCPGFLLEAVRSAIKKRRRVIKAKMLGFPVNDCSRSVCHTPYAHQWPISAPPLVDSRKSIKSCFHSDDEERSSLFGSSEVDSTEVDGADKPPESRIRNL